jgi:hypothetical protein
MSPDQIRPISTAETRLGAVGGGEADLDPISPELVLVDPALAERARRQLPDRPEPLVLSPRSAEPPSSSRRADEPPEIVVAPPLPVPTLEPRRRRTVLLAGLAFILGTFVGGFFSEWHASLGPTLEARPTLFTTPTRAAGTQQHLQGQPGSEARARERPPDRLSGGSLRPPKTTVPPHPQRARHVAWAANVLGVAARVGYPAVRLVWQRPADSRRVVVLRAPAAGRRGIVLYRGRATSFRDASTRPCTSYRYTIVNYDQRGHRSTGVPTTIVTEGCGTRQ